MITYSNLKKILKEKSETKHLNFKKMYELERIHLAIFKAIISQETPKKIYIIISEDFIIRLNFLELIDFLKKKLTENGYTFSFKELSEDQQLLIIYIDLQKNT